MKWKTILFTMMLGLLFACSKNDFVPNLDTIDQSSSRKLWSPKTNAIATLVSEQAGFSPRSFHTATVFTDMLWVIGGQDEVGRNNEVWYSPDGIHWKMTPPSTRFSARTGHTTNVFDNKLWVIGGDDGNARNDVWYSSDGFNWVEATSEADFPARTLHAATVYDNRFWVIGGLNQDLSPRKVLKNDVWQSEDGVNWTQVTSAANFDKRRNHTVNVFKGLLWVIGGVGPGFGDIRKNDVWFSSDGIYWTEAPMNSLLRFSPRSSHSTTFFANKLWLIGGLDGQVGYKGDIWSSSDSAGWQRLSEEAAFGVRVKHTATVFRDKLWVIGGITNEGNKNDVWVLDQ